VASAFVHMPTPGLVFTQQALSDTSEHMYLRILE
jgi:hypothetical protein